MQSVRLYCPGMGEVSWDGRQSGAPRGCSSPPTLLIQDLRLHMAFLLFTASHSRRWPAGGTGTQCY